MFVAGEAILYLSLVDVALCLPYRFALAWLVRWSLAPRGRRMAQAEKSSGTVRVCHALARRWPTKPACLQRSLLVVCMLRRRGLPCQLKIGASRTRDGLQAHAWVEVDGERLYGSPLQCQELLPVDRAMRLALASKDWSPA
jgi:hypothetical protein